MTRFPDVAGSLILLADPSPNPWPALQTVLSQAGYELVTVNTGSELMSVAQLQMPDGILLQAIWPDRSGVDLCQQLKLNLLTHSIPVLFVSANVDLPMRLQAFEVGAVDYLCEPFCLEEVVARLRYPVKSYRLQRHLMAQAQRVMMASHPNSLLVNLQQALRRQTQALQAQNEQLQREVQEREEAEEALRREQQKSEKLLLNILPRAVVEQLKQLQGSLAERFEEVTILFADIVNFTPLAAQITPLELVSWLNQIFSEFDRLAAQFQLEKIKTIGDAYMAVGGLPLTRADHAEAVMEMAIAMQSTVERFPRHDGQPLQLRIGINTGTVVAGVIGIRKFSYDLWGDAVNVASRMEAQGTPGKIQITEATYQRLRHRYVFEEAGQVLVKGRGYMTTYQYVASQSDEGALN
ncbi:MAG TPA: adenylate/guanylate cyclase domain-containing protein [Trichocoleus sp.]